MEKKIWTILIILTIVFTFCSFVHAESNKPKIGAPDDVYDQYFTSYTVQPGDTVTGIYYKICNKYPTTSEYWSLSDYIANVRSINHLDYDCTVISGTIIVVPYLKPDGVDVT